MAKQKEFVVKLTKDQLDALFEGEYDCVEGVITEIQAQVKKQGYK